MTNLHRATALMLTLAAALAGCTATPANQVKVATMSMDEAYDRTRRSQSPVEARIVRAVVSPQRPAPLVTAPDIRHVYVYEWTDMEGNLHYPGWVSIMVDTYKWVMPEVGAVPMDGSAGRAPLANSGDQHEGR